MTKNIGKSIRTRLLNLAKEEKQDTRYLMSVDFPILRRPYITINWVFSRFRASVIRSVSAFLSINLLYSIMLCLIIIVYKDNLSER